METERGKGDISSVFLKFLIGITQSVVSIIIFNCYY